MLDPTSPVTKKSGFTLASQFEEDVLNPLPIPVILQNYFSGIIDRFERGIITLIEADKPSIKKIHTGLHEVMVNAISKGWEVKLVDIANCFNPQLISAITLNSDVSSHKVLQDIRLARPFQIHQSMSIIKQLIVEFDQSRKRALKKGKLVDQLIIITCISSQFLDPGQASEDNNYPLPQLELLRYSLGVLQNLAMQGCTIIMTELTEESRSISNKLKKMHRRYQNTSLSYTSKIHIGLTQTEAMRTIELKNHPYLACKLVKIPIRKQRKPLDVHQSSLEGWF